MRPLIASIVIFIFSGAFHLSSAQSFKLSSSISLSSITQGSCSTFSVSLTETGGLGTNYDFEADILYTNGSFYKVFAKTCTVNFSAYQTKSVTFDLCSYWGYSPSLATGSYKINIIVSKTSCAGCGTSSTCYKSIAANGYSFPKSISIVAALSAPSISTNSISTNSSYPANGTANHIHQSWSSASGISGYQWDYSWNGSNYNPGSNGNSTGTYWVINNPNVPFYTRVRSYDASSNYSSYTYSSPNPIYTACNDPASPTVNNVTPSSLDVRLNSESPVANPSITTYAIYCSTTGQYVQSSGSLGSSPVWQTKSSWGTKTVSGLSGNTNYCFYIKAKNNDGDIRYNSSNNSCGKTTNQSCSNPSITSNPSNQTVTAPGSTSFSVSASGGNIPYTYQWQIRPTSSSLWNDIVAAGTNPKYSGWTTSTLQVSNISTSNNGYQYRCIVYSGNSCGSYSSTSNSATLTVNSSCIAPSVTNPSSKTVSEPSGSSFSVNPSGTNISNSWQYNSGSGWNTVPNNYPYSGANSSTLTISQTMTSMSGYQFRCHVTSSCTSSTATSNPATLTVNCGGVSITTHPKNSTVAVGQRATLNVTASGTSPFTYQWYKNSSPISGATSSSYTTPMLSMTDNNSYYCIVKNCSGASSNTSNPAKVTVVASIPNTANAVKQGQSNYPFADPIQIGTGTYLYHNTLMSVSSLNGVSFAIQYNTHNNLLDSCFGYGWRHSFSYSIRNRADTAWDLHYPDGHAAPFIPYEDDSNLFFPLYGGTYDSLVKTVSGYTVTTKAQVTIYFNSAGTPVEAVDPHGNTTRFVYSGNRLDSVITAGNRWLKFKYISSGKIDSVILSSGRSCYFKYDNGGNLYRAYNPMGNYRQFSYTSIHLMDTFYDEHNVPIVINRYDFQNKVVCQKDAYLDSTLIEYKSDGWAIITLPDKSTRRVHHDEFTRVDTIYDELNYRTVIHYDYNGNPDTIINEKGQQIISQYDNFGNALLRVLPGNRTVESTYNRFQKPIEIENPRGDRIVFGYNSSTGDLLTAYFPDSSIHKFDYNSDGTVKFHIDGQGDTTYYSYNSFGDLIKVQTPTGYLFYGYDADGRPDTITDQNGNKTMIYYDANDNITQIKDALNQSLYFAYDNANQLTSFKDKRGNTTYFKYDKKGRLIARKNALNGIDSFYYDSRDRMTTWRDALGHFTYYSYDAKGARIEISNAAGETKMEFDETGNPKKITDGNGNDVFIKYNAADFISSFNNGLNQRDSFERDELGNIVKHINYKGNFKEYSYSKLNQVSVVTDVLGEQTNYNYDKGGSFTSFTDGEGHTQNFTVGKSGRIANYKDAADNLYTFTYDATGNIKDISKPVGNILREYDKLNRLIKEVVSSGETNVFAYDANNNLTSAKNNVGTSNFYWDELNRLIKYVDAYGKPVSYGYNAVGSITYIVYPGGDSVQYIYDDANRLWKVIDWKDNVFTYSYDSTGKVTKLLYPNGIHCDYKYDATGRLISKITYYPADSILYGQTFDYSIDTLIIETRYGSVPAGLSSFKNAYQYRDDDAVSSDSARTFQNDSNGNRTMETNKSDTVKYSWTVDQLLESVSKQGITSSFKYDGLGHRIERTEGSETKRYVLNLNSPISLVLQTTDKNGNVKANYIWGLGLLEQVDSSGTETFYHFDASHNAVALTDDSDSIIASYTYLPYGVLIESSGTLIQPFTFLGEFGVEMETDSCYYIRARYYDASTGRFLSKDPLFGDEFEPQSLNRYIYAVNNPLLKFDVTGLTTADNDGPTAFQKFAMGKGGDILIGILEPIAFLGKLSSGILSVIPVTAPLGFTLSLTYAIIEGDYESAGLVVTGLQIPGAFSTSGTIPRTTSTAFKSFTSSNFRTNLGILTGGSPTYAQAHHVFPQTDEFLSFFKSKGINIHDPQYGSWWETASHQSSAYSYNAQWRQFIGMNPNASSSDVLNFGRKIMNQYGLPVNY